MALLALGEEFALKNIRIWFTKSGAAKYISHLDLNRCVARAFHKAKLPMWYTEGFNPHAFVTFALPLALGVQGRHESMDIRMLEELPKAEILHRLNEGLPEGIRVYDVTEPKMKPGEIAYAEYEMNCCTECKSAQELRKDLEAFLARDEILAEKKTKSGVKTLNLSDYLDKRKLSLREDGVLLYLILPAGSGENINPGLLTQALQAHLEYDLFVQTARGHLYNAAFEIFV